MLKEHYLVKKLLLYLIFVDQFMFRLHHHPCPWELGGRNIILTFPDRNWGLVPYVHAARGQFQDMTVINSLALGSDRSGFTYKL